MSTFLANQLIMVVPEKDYAAMDTYAWNANIPPETII